MIVWAGSSTLMELIRSNIGVGSDPCGIDAYGALAMLKYAGKAGNGYTAIFAAAASLKSGCLIST